jgi:hypothetical protein
MKSNKIVLNLLIVTMMTILPLIKSILTLNNTGGFIIIDTSVLPSTVNSNGVYSFILYPSSRILNTDTIKITFPIQVVLTSGTRNCQAVNKILNVSLLPVTVHLKFLLVQLRLIF